MGGIGAGIDQGVIDRAIGGDREAFSVIVRGTGGHALLVAQRILRSPEEGVCAARSLFVTAFSSLKKLKSQGFLETWLLQILVAICGERLKEKKEKDDKTGARCAVDSTTVPTLSGRTSRRLSEIAVRNEQVRRAVDDLPFKQRVAVMLRDWDGVSAIEVAEILRVSREDMRKLLSTARKTLAATLDASVLESGDDSSSVARGVGGNSTGVVNTPAGPAKGESRKKCGKNSERLWLLVGGELGQVEQTEVIVHVRRCPACQDRLARASRVVEALREAAPVEGEPSLAPDRLWEEVEPMLTR